MSVETAEKSNESLGKVFWWFGVLGMVPVVWRILFIHNDWILGTGVAILVLFLAMSPSLQRGNAGEKK